MKILKDINKYETQSFIAITKAARIAGSERILASKISIEPQKLNYWKNKGLLPYDIALEISIFTDWEVTPYELRPDKKILTSNFIHIISINPNIHNYNYETQK